MIGMIGGTKVGSTSLKLLQLTFFLQGRPMGFARTYSRNAADLPSEIVFNSYILYYSFVTKKKVRF